jgi:predicted O-linked N-acetylglucosamine transferase (SPINDLY family)
MTNPNPNLPHAIALHRAGRLPEAIAIYRQILATQPANIDALNNLAVALKAIGQIEEAIACLNTAIAARPTPELYYNLGNAQRILAQHGKLSLEDCADAYRRAIDLRPDYADAHNNLGLIRAEQGRHDEAIVHCRKAIALKPDTADAFINLLYALYHHPDSTPQTLVAETRAWAKQQNFQPAILNSPGHQAGDRLKIGYLSPFFALCADGHFIHPLLVNHDRNEFEIFCYSRTTGEDELTQRLKTHCDHWHDLRTVASPQAAALIRQDNLDLLVIMSRPADDCQKIAAQRVAHRQAVWLTFASATSGLPAVDFRLSDPHLNRPGATDADYAEKTLRLPETAWCYDPLGNVPASNEPPSKTNGFITFGSLNRLSKINARVLSAWSQLLSAVPASRLHILLGGPRERESLLQKFRDQSTTPERIEFLDRQPRHKYLLEYHRIDIALDAFPFNGHTTTFDALWMGVPVVTLAGATCVGRVAASALQNLGLNELIATSPQYYVEIAQQLANDPPRLSTLRRDLRPRMEQSPLMTPSRFARSMESLYRQIITADAP